MARGSARQHVGVPGAKFGGETLGVVGVVIGVVGVVIGVVGVVIGVVGVVFGVVGVVQGVVVGVGGMYRPTVSVICWSFAKAAPAVGYWLSTTPSCA